MNMRTYKQNNNSSIESVEKKQTTANCMEAKELTD